MNNLELKIKGMKCIGCENRIINSLSQLSEVQKVWASHETNQVIITFNQEVTLEIKNKVISILKDLDFEVEN